MKTIATNCHECHANGISTPAALATSEGDFYCRRCCDQAGLDPVMLMTVQQYLDTHGYNQPEGKPSESAVAAPAAAQVPADPAPKNPKNPKSPWRGFATLGMNKTPEAKESPQEENKTMPTETERWCSKCEKIKIKATSKTGLCVPCQCGFSATNPKRLAQEAKSAGRAPGLAPSPAKKKVAKRLATARPTAVAPSETPHADPNLARQKARREAQVPDPSIGGAATLTFSERQICRMFAALPLDQKVVVYQIYLDQVEICVR